MALPVSSARLDYSSIDSLRLLACDVDTKLRILHGHADGPFGYDAARVQLHDNRILIQDVIFNHGAYPKPGGGQGVAAMVGSRNIAGVSAIASGMLPIETISLVDPDTPAVRALLSSDRKALLRPIAYGGDDPSMAECRGLSVETVTPSLTANVPVGWNASLRTTR